MSLITKLMQWRTIHDRLDFQFSGGLYLCGLPGRLADFPISSQLTDWMSLELLPDYYGSRDVHAFFGIWQSAQAHNASIP